jgi:hypothetical protein
MIKFGGDKDYIKTGKKIKSEKKVAERCGCGRLRI